MEAIYRLFTLRPLAPWNQLDPAKQQTMLSEIQQCWQTLGGQLIVEHPMVWQDVEPTWLAFGIAGELDLIALQALLDQMAKHEWDQYVDCELPTFLQVDSTTHLSSN